MAEQTGFALPENLGVRPPRDLLPEELRKLAKQKKRKCLSCSNLFDSHGPGNRVCQRCKDCVAWSSPADYSLSTAAF